VYMAGLRFNSLRDLSTVNPWGTGTWETTPRPEAAIDETAIGLVLRMLQAGIRVRILVWLPVIISEPKRLANLAAHAADHFYLADLVRAESERLRVRDLGIVGLDIRVAARKAATHHQKMLIIRVGTTHVAYCGGVDLTFTRRDAPNANHPYEYDPNRFNDLSKPAPQFLGGDWESGVGIPTLFVDPSGDRTNRWPRARVVDYTSVGNVPRFKNKQDSDLPSEVYGKGDRPEMRQTWHDQHFRLEGPIVKTLEEQFAERWIDVSPVFALEEGFGLGRINWSGNQVIFSSRLAFDNNKKIIPLDTPADVEKIPGGTSAVQMWRTIPLRLRGKTDEPLFTRGEYTIMAGIDNACRASTQLIWIFDQYLFSQPLCRLLNQQIKDHPSLYVLLILPPFADEHQLAEHHARKLALNAMTAGLTFSQPSPDIRLYDRVGIYNLWRPGGAANDPNGIYCHAKVQMYDRTLLVCGSANLNRKSFTCDSELDCAVLDPALVDKHQQWLWKVLFPNGRPWPSQINFSADDWGKKFFAEFQEAAKKENHGFLVPDPWWQVKTEITLERDEFALIKTTPPQTPNAFAREQDYPEDYLDEARRQLGLPLTVGELLLIGQKEPKSPLVELLMDPTSIETKVEENVCTSDTPGKDPHAAGRLDEIVYLLEACYYKNKRGQLVWPWRK
jgi:phosphatidylserine/phosphatidylglycerophosphate/cardiolipin synthase-like enzyme